MVPSISYRSLAYPFARGLLDKARASATLNLSDFQRRRLQESIAVDIRKFGDMAYPAVRQPGVSVKAQDVAAALGVDLRCESWQSQPRFDLGRRALHYEHSTPVGSIRADIAECRTVEGVMHALERVRLTWITKAEDAALTKLGYRNKRPNPCVAYEEAGIALTASDAEVEPSLDAGFGEHSLIEFLRQALDEERSTALRLHQQACPGLEDPTECTCAIGRRVEVDATAKLRLLHRFSQRGEPEATNLVATYLACAYADMPGYQEEWSP